MGQIVTPNEVAGKLNTAEARGDYYNAGSTLNNDLTAIYGFDFKPQTYQSQQASGSQETLQNRDFSAFATEIGVRQNFDCVRFSIFPGDATNLPTYCRVVIRNATYDGTVLADVLIALVGVTHNVSHEITAELGVVIANAGGAEIVLAVITDGVIGYGSATDYPTALLRYGSDMLITSNETPTAVVSAAPEIYAQTFLCDTTNPFILDTFNLFVFNYSTFSGFGNLLSKHPAGLNIVGMWINAFDTTSLPSRIRIRFRDGGHTGAVIATALADVVFSVPGTQYVQFFFSTDVDLSGYSQGSVWMEYLADGRVSFGVSLTNSPGSAWYTFGPAGIDGNLIAQLSGPIVAQPWFTSALQVRSNRRLKTTAISAAVQPPGSSIDCELLLPPKLYCVAGYEANLYWEAVVMSWLRPEQLNISVTCTRGKHLAKRWTWVADGADTGLISLIATVGHNGTTLASGTTSLSTVTDVVGEGQTRKVLLIGDSLTNAETMQAQMLTNVATSSSTYVVTLLGTQGTGSNKHEGYPGKTYEWHNSNVTAPFVTAGEFDFAQYLTDNSYSMTAGDSVYFLLGTNDFFGMQSDAECSSKIIETAAIVDAWITNIQTAVPGINIWIGLPIPAPTSQDGAGIALGSTYNRDRYARNFHLWTKHVIDNYGSRSADNIRLCPLHCNLDTINNFPTVTQAVNSRNATTETIINNDVHPASSGYQQMGDTLYCCQKSLETDVALATNLLTWSEKFDNAVWETAFLTKTIDATATFSGAVTADLVTPDVGVTLHSIKQEVSSVPATPHTFSVYVKPGGGRYVGLYLQSISKGVTFDLQTGTYHADLVGAPSSYTITPKANGFYRISITGTPAGGTEFPTIHLIDSDGSSYTYNGDGTSGMYLGGAMFHAGSAPKSYNPRET